MARTLQRLTERQALYNVNIIGAPLPIADYNLSTYWTVTNGTASLINDDFFVSNRYVMKIIPSSSAPVTISTNATNGILEGDSGLNIVFTSVFKFGVNAAQTETKIYKNSEIVAGETKAHNASVWSVVRSNRMTYQYSVGTTVTAKVEVSNHGSQPIYMTMPAVVNDDAFINAPAVLASKVYMPDFYWQFDGQSVSPTYPLFRFVDICTWPISEAAQMYANWFEYETGELPYNTSRDDLRTRSALLHPDNFYLAYRNWIWQFIGSPFLRNVYDPADNAAYIADEEEYARWQARTAHFGHGAGSRKAIREAAEFVLSGTKTVVITPKFSGDPFQISVKTLVSETPDVAMDGDVSAAVLAAVESARPVGFKIVHEAVDEIIFTLDDIEQGLLDVGQLG
jgi:hypothetical protein